MADREFDRDGRDQDRDGEGGSGSKAAKEAFGRRRKPRPEKDYVFDYRNVDTLSAFVSERGKIVPRRISRLNAKQQRKLTQAVKRARMIAVLPFAGQE